jgi:hypothetical protein
VVVEAVEVQVVEHLVVAVVEAQVVIVHLFLVKVLVAEHLLNLYCLSHKEFNTPLQSVLVVQQEQAETTARFQQSPPLVVDEAVTVLTLRVTRVLLVVLAVVQVVGGHRPQVLVAEPLTRVVLVV